MGWQPPVTEVARDIQSYDTFYCGLLRLYRYLLLLCCYIVPLDSAQSGIQNQLRLLTTLA